MRAKFHCKTSTCSKHALLAERITYRIASEVNLPITGNYMGAKNESSESHGTRNVITAHENQTNTHYTAFVSSKVNVTCANELCFVICFYAVST